VGLGLTLNPTCPICKQQRYLVSFANASKSSLLGHGLLMFRQLLLPLTNLQNVLSYISTYMYESIQRRAKILG